MNTKTPTQLMVNLGFYNYTLGKGSLLAFKDLLKGQSNIGTLHINTSDVSAENVTVALKSIIEGLADGSSCCGISIGHIALKSIHAYYLALLLYVSTSLDSLVLSSCDLQNHKRMSLFSEALKFSTIVSLSLNNCWIDDTWLNFLGKQ